MRIRRAPKTAARDSWVVADAGGMATWDADGTPRSRRRRRVLIAAALALAALVLAAVAIARAGDGREGDILALGPAEDPNALPPLEDSGLLTDGGVSAGQSQLTPGDSIPGVAAGGDPAAVAAGGGATGGGTPGAAGAAGPAGGGATPSGGGAAGGVPPGPGPGEGIPTPTTRPGSTGTPTTGSAGTTSPPAQCAIAEASAAPNPVDNQRGGGSKKLIYPVVVSFRPTNCGNAEYRVQGNGLDLVAFASATRPGFYDVNIGTETKWTDGKHTMTIVGGGAATTLDLFVN